jgi:phosphonopyruvate decarboxylase
VISAEDFCQGLRDWGFELATGVPCSHFGGPIALLSREAGGYVPAANEGNALAIAAGSVMAGRPCYVMLQNSGLGNLINPLSSLLMTFDIPVLVFVSQRGCPDPADDEPQHEVMGPATAPVLAALGVATWPLAKAGGLDEFRTVLDLAQQELAKGRPAFVLVEKGAVGKAQSTARAAEREGVASGEAIKLIAAVAEGSALIATTGYTGRELFGLADAPGNFYMQGSMGHASSIGLGVALAKPERSVVVLDGDGAALMHLGSLSVVGDQGPENFVHVILDNGAHESTGGQRTTSGSTSFAPIALAAGYRTAEACTSLSELEKALRAALEAPGPHLIAVRTRLREGEVPPRATTTFSAQELRDRFSEALQDH